MSALIQTFEQTGRESWMPRAGTFALVLAAHVALTAWVSLAAAGKNEDPAPARMDVRMIEMAAPRAPDGPKPLPQQAKPAPAVERQPMRRPAPALAPAVLATAPAAAQAPTTFAVPPQTPAPSREEAAPAAASAPAAAPVVGPRFDADYLQNPSPVYPPLSRKLHEEGKVLLFVQVSAKGEAEGVEVRKSSGFPRLDEAATSAVRKWRFVPARRGAEPIASSVVVPLVFRLDS